jgi:hypothetical protein
MAAKKDNWIPWLIIGGLVLYVMNQQPKGGGDPSTEVGVESVVKATIPNIRAAYKAAFLEAAKRIESGDIKDQEQWTEFIKANAGAKQSEALSAVYRAIDELKLPVSFAGKEKEIAELNRKIGGAW